MRTEVKQKAKRLLALAIAFAMVLSMAPAELTLTTSATPPAYAAEYMPCDGSLPPVYAPDYYTNDKDDYSLESDNDYYTNNDYYTDNDYDYAYAIKESGFAAFRSGNIYVSPHGTGDGSHGDPMNLRDAIAAAASGDTIVLFSGEYVFEGANLTANVEIPATLTNVTIRGYDPNNKPVLRFHGQNFFIVRGSGTALDGLAFTTTGAVSHNDFGLVSLLAQNTVLRSSDIFGTHANLQQVIRVQHAAGNPANITITGNRIFDHTRTDVNAGVLVNLHNEANQAGTGVIRIQEGNGVTISNNEFFNLSGNAIYLRTGDNNSATSRNITVTNNFFHNMGGHALDTQSPNPRDNQNATHYLTFTGNVMHNIATHLNANSMVRIDLPPHRNPNLGVRITGNLYSSPADLPMFTGWSFLEVDNISIRSVRVGNNATFDYTVTGIPPVDCANCFAAGYLVCQFCDNCNLYNCDCDVCLDCTQLICVCLRCQECSRLVANCVCCDECSLYNCICCEVCELLNCICRDCLECGYVYYPVDLCICCDGCNKLICECEIPCAVCDDVYCDGACYAHGLGLNVVFVAADADPSGTGTLGRPIALNRAMTAAAAGQTIFLRGGTYSFYDSFALGFDFFAINNSGTEAAPITITNFPGETPVIDGQNRDDVVFIRGNWIIVDGLHFTNMGEGGPTSAIPNVNHRIGMAVSGNNVIIRNNEFFNNFGRAVDIAGGGAAANVPNENVLFTNNIIRDHRHTSNPAISENGWFAGAVRVGIGNHLQPDGTRGIPGGGANMQSGSRNVVISNNLFFNAYGGVGLSATNTRNVMVANNTFHNLRDPAIQTGNNTPGSNSFHIINNIFYNTATRGGLQGGYARGHIHSPHGNTVGFPGGSWVFNNVYSGNVELFCARIVTLSNFTGGSVRHGSNTLFDGTGPLFTNAAAGDFSLLTGSVAINHGLSELPAGLPWNVAPPPAMVLGWINDAFSYGICGTSRLLSDRDAGAFEYYDPNYVPNPRVVITAEPQDIYVALGLIGSYTRLSIGYNVLFSPNQPTFQWFTGDGVPIIGATRSYFVIPDGTAPGTHRFFAEVTPPGGTVPVRTRTATVTVNQLYGALPQPIERDFLRTVHKAGVPHMFYNEALRPVDPANPALTPIMRDGAIMLPLAAMQVAIDADSIVVAGATATVTRDGVSHQFPVTVEAGVYYLPGADVARAFGDSVGWDPVSNTLIVVTGINVVQRPGPLHFPTGQATKNRQPAEWFGSQESIRLADNFLLFQLNSGVWITNTDFAIVMTEADINAALGNRGSAAGSLDNDATMPETEFLMRMYQATKIERYRVAYMRALEAVLAVEYPSGGFPQLIARPDRYPRAVTFNDDAILNVLELWLDIVEDPDYFFSLPTDTWQRIYDSLFRGIVLILNTQIFSHEQNMLTSWAQQYWCCRDAACFNTCANELLPSWARHFEPPSISGGEGVDLTRFLMSLDPELLEGKMWNRTASVFYNRPGTPITLWEGVQNAIHAAVAFYAHVEITGYRRTTTNVSGPTFDNRWTAGAAWGGGVNVGTNSILVADPLASGLWARFICIDSFRPLLTDNRNPIFQPLPAHNAPPDVLREYTIYGPLDALIRDIWANGVHLHLFEPVATGRPSGASLRNICVEGCADVTQCRHDIDLIATYANLSWERRNFYTYFLTGVARGLPAEYRIWLEQHGLEAPFSAVRDIVGIPEIAVVDVPFQLTATVIPGNATNTDIIWSVYDAGTTGATVDGDFATATATGTLLLEATIINGLGEGLNYSQIFTVTILSHIAVEEIIGVPAFLPIGTYNLFRADVLPATTAMRYIIWTVTCAGDTGAVITGNTLTTTAHGSVTLRATVAGGADDGSDFTQYVTIPIHADPTVNLAERMHEQYLLGRSQPFPADALVRDMWVHHRDLFHNTGQTAGNWPAVLYEWSWSYRTNLRLNDPIELQFGDRGFNIGFMFTQVPDFLLGADWIQTPNNARDGIGPNTQMMFTANADIDVFLTICASRNILTIPWVDDTWTFMGTDYFIVNNEALSGLSCEFTGEAFPAGSPRRQFIFRKTFLEGEVFRLGAFNQGTATGNSLVIIKPASDIPSVCDICQMYPCNCSVSYVEFLQMKADAILSNGFTEFQLILSANNRATLTLVLDGRSIVLATNVNNLNQSGRVELPDGSGTLVFDIRGNGSNVREFRLIPN